MHTIFCVDLDTLFLLFVFYIYFTVYMNALFGYSNNTHGKIA